MSVPNCLGQLNYLRIWHDNSGKGKYASWYLTYVIVKDLQTGCKYEFIVDRWFAVEEDDGMIEHLIPVAGKAQVNQFSHLFPVASRRNLADNHLWLSVFLRPPRSRFTRVQRLSCCLSVFYLSMLTSAMWYERTSEQPKLGAFKFGPFSLSPEEIAVGVLSNLIVFPPSFITIFFFRKSRIRSLRKSHVNEAIEKQYSIWRKKFLKLNNNKDVNTLKNQRRDDDEAAYFKLPQKKKFLLPWWCAGFGWLLIIISVGASIFFLWAYGLQFGNERTSKWLSSLIISFISSLFLVEPLKIICFSLLVSCLYSNPDVDNDDADDDEEEPSLKTDEEWLHDININLKIPRQKYRPLDIHALEAARKKREKEVQMQQILREIMAYILYLWVLIVLSYGNRDPNSFFLREAVINNFIKPGDLWNDFNNVNNEIRFWNWTREALLPELFAGKWYNEQVPLGLRLLVDDRNNFKIGYAVLRQVRAKPNSCTPPINMQYIVSECSSFSNIYNEDGEYYEKMWHHNRSVDARIPPEYKYMSAIELNGFPFWGQLDWYGGGGYIVPLVARRYEDGSKLIKKLNHLERTGWISKHTRAVFVEFGVYNAQVNLFVVATIVAEFLPGGGIVPYYHIDPIKLLLYHTGSGVLQLACQLAFVVFTLYHTVCEIVKLCKQGRKYFSQYWNIAELANLLVSYTGIGIEIYKQIITRRILAIFSETEGTGYIKLQEALILDMSLCYLIGFLMSLATLKFLKLLKFNKRIGTMIGTLNLCAQELQSYGICLMIVFFAFVALFWLIFGRTARDFCSFVKSFGSSISMMLKKFNYEAMQEASPILAPIAFFTFALTASVILVNILLTIIIQSFEEVKYDIAFKNNDYELMSHILKRFKHMLGIYKAPKITPITFKADPKNNTVESFNGKVDKLLEFINTVYLEEEVNFSKKEFLKVAQAPHNEKILKKKPHKIRPHRIPRPQVKRHIDF